MTFSGKPVPPLPETKPVQPRRASDTQCFDNLFGLDAAKAYLKHFIFPHLPASLLITGMPGDGKTMLLRAIAGELDIEPTPIRFEFHLKYCGEAERYLTDLFDEAAAQPLSFVFLDDADHFLCDDPRFSHITRKLLELLDRPLPDGHRMLFAAASNAPWMLPDAFVYSMKHHIHLPGATAEERRDFLKAWAESVPHEAGLDLSIIERTVDNTPRSELKTLCNRISNRVINRGLQTNDFNVAVTQHDVDSSLDRPLFVHPPEAVARMAAWVERHP